MKKSNLVVGTKVQVKSDSGRFYSWHAGELGEITRVDESGSDLDVKVEFAGGDTDWGNHKDLKLVRD